jgi:hypothetical protein
VPSIGDAENKNAWEFPTPTHRADSSSVVAVYAFG